MEDGIGMDAETEIRRLIENWAIWRDAGMWDKLRSAWHSDGTMRATWFDGSADDFVANCIRARENGVTATHFLGGSYVEIMGQRSVVHTRMSIIQRTIWDGDEIDVICTGRFVDFLSEREGTWKISRRQLIYESDRVVPVVPGAVPRFDQEVLTRFPVGYRHLACIQTEVGFDVFPDLPGREGPAHDALMDRARNWLGVTQPEDA